MPVISNSKVGSVLNGSLVDVTVTWDTDVAADGTVVWSQGGSVLGRLQDFNFVTTRSITIPGLAPDTAYSVLLASSTERGQDCGCDPVNPGTACTLPFTTPSAPVIIPGDPPAVAPSATTAVISWQTAKPGLGTVLYRRDGDSADSSESEDQSGTDHRVELQDLIGSSHYVGHTTTDLDDSDDTVVSPEFGFDTASDNTPDDPPGRVTLCLSPALVKVGGSATFTVQLRHDHGQPNPGVALEFSLGAGQADCALSASSGVTDAQGRCSIQVSARAIPAGRRKARRAVVVVASGGGKHKRRRAVLTVKA